MTLAQLLRETPWPDIRVALLRLFPEAEASIHEFERLDAALRRLRPHISSMRIVVEAVPLDEPTGAMAFDVTGRDGTLNRDLPGYEHLGAAATEIYGDQEATYSLCLRARAEWLGMTVDDKTLVEFAPSHIIACCLDEMAFHGFDEAQVEAFANELELRMHEINAMSAEERDRHLVPAEEVFASLADKSADRH
ncbi:MAG: hypothetical protein JJU27_12315 [Gammaproteobacteria bacterium]|nr:hypothetical protein [Gammaproteobacteria bacterium]